MQPEEYLCGYTGGKPSLFGLRTLKGPRQAGRRLLSRRRQPRTAAPAEGTRRPSTVRNCSGLTRSQSA